MADQEYSDNKQSSDLESDSDIDAAEMHRETSSSDNSELARELDNILDEIDSVLESNAEEFVKSYVQKGGQ